MQLYTPSHLAVSPETWAERSDLDMLAGRLALADALIDYIGATVSTAKV